MRRIPPWIGARTPGRTPRAPGAVALVPIVALALCAACSEDDRNPVGAGELPQLSDSIQEVNLAPVEISTFVTGTDDRVFGDTLVAAHDLPDPAGFESHVVLRFALAISDTSRGPVTVDSAQVRFVVHAPSPDSLGFALHRVTESWSESEVSWAERMFGVPWSEPGGTFDPTPVLEGALVADSVTFALPDTLVQHWLDDPSTNDGLLLRLLPPASQVRLVAASTTGLTNQNGPRLRLFVTAGDSSGVSNVFATNDAYLAEYRGAVAPGVAAGNEPLFRSVLTFDVSRIPRNASINLAELTLVPRQVVTPVEPLRLETRRVVSRELDGQTVFSTTALSGDSVRADSTITISNLNLATLVRLWQADSTLNLGLGVQVTRDPGNLGFAVFADSTADPEDGVRLRIIFTPPLSVDSDRVRP